jgi:hypothetical protein
VCKKLTISGAKEKGMLKLEHPLLFCRYRGAGIRLRSHIAQRGHAGLTLPRWRQNFSGVLLIVGLEEGLLDYAIGK